MSGPIPSPSDVFGGREKRSVPANHAGTVGDFPARRKLLPGEEVSDFVAEFSATSGDHLLWYGPRRTIKSDEDGRRNRFPVVPREDGSWIAVRRWLFGEHYAAWRRTCNMATCIAPDHHSLTPHIERRELDPFPYIAERTYTLPSGHTFWAGDLHPAYGWPCIPPEVSHNGSYVSVARFLYSHWTTPGTVLRFHPPRCGVSGCLVSGCQVPYDVTRG